MSTDSQKHPLQDELELELEKEGAPNVKEKLTTLQRLYEKWQTMKTKQGQLEEDLKDLNKGLNGLEFDTLPNILMECGLSQVKLSDGTTLTLRKEVYPSITKANRNKAYKWLKDNGFGDIIKSVLALVFDAGEEGAGSKTKFHKFIVEQGVPCTITDKESIHASTLKATIREALEDGTVFPPELFSIHIATPVKIRPGK